MNEIIYEKQRYSLSLGDVDFIGEIWDGQTSPLQDSCIAIDTETLLIEKGEVPPIATLQVYYPTSRFVQLIQGQEKAAEYFQKMMEYNPGSKLIFHNFPFDYEVLGGKKNTALFNAIRQKRVIDTGIRWLLHQSREGNWITEKMPWHLDYIVLNLVGLELEKNDDIRLTFKPDVKLSDEHIKYACLDPVATYMCYERMPGEYPTEELQVKAAVALNKLSLNGMGVDLDMFKKLKQKYSKLKMDQEDILMYYGVFQGVKGKDNRIQELLLNIEKRCGIRFPRTPTKKISASSKVIALFPEKVHPYLTAAKLAQNASKFLSSYLDEKFIGKDNRVHARYNTLVRTGRTSAQDPPIQQMPRDGGIREQYRAAPGHCLLAIDYSQQELVALAQNCLVKYGQSKMAEIINTGEDLHRALGKKIMEATGGNEKDGVDWRQCAKSVNFGAPGGLAAATFVAYARDSYGVHVTEERAAQLIQIWKETFPEMAMHLKPPPDPDHPGMYIGKTISGRIRSNCMFCSALNFSFQGLASDCSKLALWNFYINDIKSTGFVHDEIVSEWPIDGNLQQAVELGCNLMLNSMGVYCPQVMCKVEASLMINWNKKAKPIFDKDGHRLLIWTPDIVAVNKKDKNESWRKLVNRPFNELTTMDPKDVPVPDGYRIVWNEGGKSLYGYQPLKSAYN